MWILDGRVEIGGATLGGVMLASGLIMHSTVPSLHVMADREWAVSIGISMMPAVGIGSGSIGDTTSIGNPMRGIGGGGKKWLLHGGNDITCRNL